MGVAAAGKKVGEVDNRWGCAGGELFDDPLFLRVGCTFQCKSPAGEQARPIPVINWTLFSAEGWQMSSYMAGKDAVITTCVNRCEDSQTNWEY